VGGISRSISKIFFQRGVIRTPDPLPTPMQSNKMIGSLPPFRVIYYGNGLKSNWKGHWNGTYNSYNKHALLHHQVAVPCNDKVNPNLLYKSHTHKLRNGHTFWISQNMQVKKYIIFYFHPFHTRTVQHQQILKYKNLYQESIWILNFTWWTQGMHHPVFSTQTLSLNF
jgi:hypothetical protein